MKEAVIDKVSEYNHAHEPKFQSPFGEVVMKAALGITPPAQEESSFQSPFGEVVGTNRN
jgi:hypothetical protein